MATVLTTRGRTMLFFAALLLGAAVIGNALIEPHFAFTSYDANQFTVGLALLMPAVMALAGPPMLRGRWRTVAAIALWLAALPFGPPSLFFLGEPFYNLAFSQSATTFVSSGRYTLAVYDFEGQIGFDWVAVDQVCRIVPGLVFSRRLYARTGLTHPDVRTLSVRPLVGSWC